MWLRLLYLAALDPKMHQNEISGGSQQGGCKTVEQSIQSLVPRMQTSGPTSFVRALEQISDYWSPRVVGRVNDQYVKVAKLKGQLAWHKHEQEDEMFLVVYGQLRLQFEDKEVELNSGEFYVVPKNTMHNPVAEEECGIVLIETMTTLHTGNVKTSLTKTVDQQLAH